MLRQMAGKFDQLGGQFNSEFDHRIPRIEPSLLHLHLAEALAPTAPHGIGKCGRDILRQPERLADIADGAARAVMDHGCDDRGAMTAIAAIDILHHLLAPRMLEIDIDIRRLQPLLGKEALEQKIDLGRIDRGDAEHVTDGGVCGRSPALAQDFLVARIVHDVVHGEKIMRVFELGDQREFFFQGGTQRVVDLAAEIFVDPPPQVRSCRCCCAVLPGGTGSSGY